MMRKLRSLMKPGDMFVVDRRAEWRGLVIESYAVMVVLDGVYETDFWRGGLSCFGGVMPAVEFALI